MIANLFKKIFISWLIPLIISVLLAEIALSIMALPQLAAPVRENLFWQADAELGWAHAPRASGVFSNGLYEGHIEIDQHGNRKNSRIGTFNPYYKNIFFIGDSTTASMEVDDDQTIPALLEKKLRGRGHKVNVLNLGVRGYGTDQSIQKAIRLGSSHFIPTDIIYMYVDNDIYNNNTLKKFRRQFGKGVHVRYPGQTKFQQLNIPVPDYAANDVGLILFDQDCEPSVYETSLPVRKKNIINTIKDWMRTHLHSYRALLLLKTVLTSSIKEKSPPPPETGSLQNYPEQGNLVGHGIPVHL